MGIVEMVVEGVWDLVMPKGLQGGRMDERSWRLLCSALLAVEVVCKEDALRGEEGAG